MSEQHGTVHWNELATRDVAAAKDFYGRICGWTYDDMKMADGGSYTIAMLGEKMVGGIFDMASMAGMEQVPPNWMMYLAVDDVDAAAAATAKAGGMVVREPWDVPMVGRIAIVTDPSGAVVGLMTPAPTPA